MTSYTIEDGDGVEALDENQQHYRGDGIGVVDPAGGDLAVSINTGTPGSTDTLSVAAGEAYIQGTTHSIGAQSIGIDSANGTNPRRDVVYVDDTGAIAVATGTPEAKDPADGSLTRFEHFRPAPPDLSGTAACVLAEVWVPAGAVSITSSDLRDRRLRALQADSVVEDLATQADLTSANYSDSDVLDLLANEDTVDFGGLLALSDYGSAPGVTGQIARDGQDLKVYSGGAIRNLSNVTQSGTLGIDIENSDGTTDLASANPIQAGTDLEWNDDGDGSATLNYVGGSGSGSAFIAQPGDVQAAIDNAHSNGGGLVKLDPSADYALDSTFPWAVKSDVTLDFNGATLFADAGANNPGVDVIHVWPRGRVLQAQVDLFRAPDGSDYVYAGGNEFQGDVFTLDPAFNGRYFADGTTVQASDVVAVQSQGAVCRLEATNTGTGDNVNNSIGLIDLHFNFRQPYQAANSPPSFANGVVMDNSFGDGWINTVNFSGHWEAADVFLRQRGGEPMNQNEFDVTIQPDNSSHMWLIESGAFVRQNQMTGSLWDRPEFSDSSAIWEINSSYDNGGNQACRNNSTLMDNMEASNATNNGSNTHYVNNKHTLSSTSI